MSTLMDTIPVPQQNSGWACGFYMLKNIMEFIGALYLMRDNPNINQISIQYRLSNLKILYIKKLLCFFLYIYIGFLQVLTFYYDRNKTIRTKTVIRYALIKVLQSRIQ